MTLRKIGKFLLYVIALLVVLFAVFGITSGSGDEGLAGKARIKNFAENLTMLREVMQKYQAAHQALPGDDANASKRWTGIANGNGDGVIQGEFNSRKQDHESAMFWQHLKSAGLVDRDFSTNIQLGLVGVQMAGAASSSPVMICSADLTWRLAQGADALIDDGVPNTGAVMSYLQNGKVLADAANPTRGSPVITFDSKLEDALYTVCQHK
jgi:hypothetical protein